MNICSPFIPGDVMTGVTRIVEMYDKENKGKPGKFMEFTVLEAEIRNQRGELAIRVPHNFSGEIGGGHDEIINV